MPLNITTNSAAASAGYYLGKNQSALQKSLNRLASGKEDHRTLRRPGESVGFHETAGLHQSSRRGPEQRSKWNIVSRSTGRYPFLRRSDCRPHGRTQGTKQSGSNEELFGPGILQRRVQGSAGAVIPDVTADLQRSQFVRSVHDRFHRSAYQYGNPVQRGHIKRQYAYSLHEFRRKRGFTGERAQVDLPFCAYHRFEFDECVHLRDDKQIQYLKHIGNRIQLCGVKSRDKFHTGRSIRGRILEGSGEHCLSSGSKRGHHVQADLFRRDDLTDAHQHEGRARPDCRCRHRRGKHRTREEPGSGTGLGSHARSSQLNHRYRSHAASLN